MIRFKKSTEPQLDIDNASKILENIFAANQAEPNTIPLDSFIIAIHFHIYYYFIMGCICLLRV